MKNEQQRALYAITRTLAYGLNFGGRRTRYEALERQDPLFPLAETSHVFSNSFGFAVSTVSLFPSSSVLPDVTIAEHAFQPEQVTPFGHLVQQAVAGKAFVDLGSGIPEMAQVPRLVAQAFGASEYVGVDSMLFQRRQTRQAELRSGSQTFVSQYFRERILPFLAKIKRPKNGLAFYLSGLEIQPHHQPEGVAYFDAMLTEIGHITKHGDAIILGLATDGIYPENYGFTLVGQSTPNREDKPTHRLYVKN